MDKLIIKNKFDEELATLDQWEEGFCKVAGRKHWKQGYSAYSLGLFFTSGAGYEWLDTISKSIIKEPIEWNDARIEHESKLDGYGGKHRIQDLALWGKTPSNKKIFIGIEAKVLEQFGNRSVREEYEDALDYQQNKKNNSNRPRRVEEVTDFLFPGKSPYDDEICYLRYQLMYYFKASILEASSYSKSKSSFKKRENDIDIVILPVLVFKTSHYNSDNVKAEINKKDFNDFCNALNLAQDIIGPFTVRTGVINGKRVITFYEEVVVDC